MQAGSDDHPTRLIPYTQAFLGGVENTFRGDLRMSVSKKCCHPQKKTGAPHLQYLH